MLLKDIQSNTNSVRNANGIMASTQKSLLCKLLKQLKYTKITRQNLPAGILKIPVGMLRMLAYSKETFRYNRL